MTNPSFLLAPGAAKPYSLTRILIDPQVSNLSPAAPFIVHAEHHSRQERMGDLFIFHK